MFLFPTLTTKWHVRSAKTDQPSLIRIFAVCIKKAWVLSYLLSDWADAEADLRWAHMPFCRFCHALAHLKMVEGLNPRCFTYVTVGDLRRHLLGNQFEDRHLGRLVMNKIIAKITQLAFFLYL